MFKDRGSNHMAQTHNCECFMLISWILWILPEIWERLRWSQPFIESTSLWLFPCNQEREKTKRKQDNGYFNPSEKVGMQCVKRHFRCSRGSLLKAPVLAFANSRLSYVLFFIRTTERAWNLLLSLVGVFFAIWTKLPCTKRVPGFDFAWPLVWGKVWSKNRQQPVNLDSQKYSLAITFQFPTSAEVLHSFKFTFIPVLAGSSPLLFFCSIYHKL